ncbi:Re/Si-specific NAD(P)(+) transhydrogenase subunit alpha [Puteibacter caeruleilacunae]|nr:Re/Si-specific NAD(P)(+) transhydrogenase subunit alpha [Puteibacter caeruleilacunae]
MIIGLLKESHPEQRVAMLPENIKSLVDMNVDIWIEDQAGVSAFISNEKYEEVGAIIRSRKEILSEATIILQINPISEEELSHLTDHQVIIGVLNPLREKELVASIKEKNLTSFSLDSIPRTTRAQAMDVLSSMATVAGYKAVLEAAMQLPTFFPMFMTAAGTIRPANVLILGAGVAGLQAIATARKLGAQVSVFDVRAAVKEEVMSLGGKFVDVEGAKEDRSAGGYAVEQTEEYKQKQQEAINTHALKSDVIICTAQIPGRKAPLLISKEIVEQMKPGSVIIDLAASTGGNCEVTVDNQMISHHGINVIGNSNYPSSMPLDASRMFSKNLFNFLKLIINDKGDLNLDFDDDIVQGTCITHQGEIINERVKSQLT